MLDLEKVYIKVDQERDKNYIFCQLAKDPPKLRIFIGSWFMNNINGKQKVFIVVHYKYKLVSDN